MKKKFLLLIVCLMIVSVVSVFSFAGCKTNQTTASTKSTKQESSVETTKAAEETMTTTTQGEIVTKKEQRYVMVVLISTHPFWTEIKKGAQDAADQLGVKFEFTGPVEYDAAAQADQVEQLITTKPSGLMIGSYDPSMTSSIDKAANAGIPVITFDSDASASKRLCFIGPNFYDSGLMYGKKMAELLGGKGKVGILTVQAQTNLQERVRGIKDYFSANAKDIEVVAIEDNGGDDQVTADKTKAIIQAHPDINGIIVVNATGSGVATALKETNKVGKVKALVSDVSDPIMQGIIDGAIDATLVVNIYLEGYMSLRLLYDYVNGAFNNNPWKTAGASLLPSYINPGSFFVTKDNADKFLTKK
jgi:ribose transport system substrate-binding protein